MKKYLLTILFLAAAISAFAQKSYVVVYETAMDYDNILLSGDIPEGISPEYNGELKYGRPKIKIGDLLNALAESGFKMEFITSCAVGSSTIHMETKYVLSRENTSTPPVTTNLITTQKGINEDAYEVARYNLQGLPVTSKDKGVQIVVYSNYTTKTIIQE